jgi:hypothetical protein
VKLIDGLLSFFSRSVLYIQRRYLVMELTPVDHCHSAEGVWFSTTIWGTVWHRLIISIAGCEFSAYWCHMVIHLTSINFFHFADRRCHYDGKWYNCWWEQMRDPTPRSRLLVVIVIVTMLYNVSLFASCTIRNQPQAGSKLAVCVWMAQWIENATAEHEILKGAKYSYISTMTHW